MPISLPPYFLHGFAHSLPPFFCKGSADGVTLFLPTFLRPLGHPALCAVGHCLRGAVLQKEGDVASGCDVYVVDEIREGIVVKCGKAKRLGCQLLQDILMDAVVAAVLGGRAGK